MAAAMTSCQVFGAREIVSLPPLSRTVGAMKATTRAPIPSSSSRMYQGLRRANTNTISRQLSIANMHPISQWKQLAIAKDCEIAISGSALVGFLALSGAANAEELNLAYGELGQGLEFGVQLLYLGALLAYWESEVSWWFVRFLSGGN